MNYNHRDRNTSTLAIRVMCASVFLLFSLFWLYFLQADVLAMTQRVLSGGATSYNPVVGTLLITIVLFVVQFIVFGLTHLKKRAHALTYLPSMLILATLSDVSRHIVPEAGNDYMVSWWLVLLILLLWLGVIYICRQYQEAELDDTYSILSRPMWINMLTMALEMMIVAWLGNTNAVFHYRMKAESLVARGQYEKALEVGDESLEADAPLMMIRMYALARTDALGERLFEYPVSGSSSEILPTNGKARLLLCPEDSIYRFLGARPAEPMEPERYLRMLQRRDSVPRKAIGDYLLCSYLIDKNLDRFARELGGYYPIDERLPKHYREALTLYIHSRANPLYVQHFSVTEEDFDNYREMERLYALPSERKGKVGEHYRGTYWYYYEYE